MAARNAAIGEEEWNGSSHDDLIQAQQCKQHKLATQAKLVTVKQISARCSTVATVYCILATVYVEARLVELCILATVYANALLHRSASNPLTFP